MFGLPFFLWLVVCCMKCMWCGWNGNKLLSTLGSGSSGSGSFGLRHQHAILTGIHRTTNTRDTHLCGNCRTGSRFREWWLADSLIVRFSPESIHWNNAHRGRTLCFGLFCIIVRGWIVNPTADKITQYQNHQPHNLINLYGNWEQLQILTWTSRWKCLFNRSNGQFHLAGIETTCYVRTNLQRLEKLDLLLSHNLGSKLCISVSEYQLLQSHLIMPTK